MNPQHTVSEFEIGVYRVSPLYCRYTARVWAQLNCYPGLRVKCFAPECLTGGPINFQLENEDNSYRVREAPGFMALFFSLWATFMCHLIHEATTEPYQGSAEDRIITILSSTAYTAFHYISTTTTTLTRLAALTD